MRITQSNVGLISGVIYTGGSLAAGLAFFVATLIGDFGWVARVGGSLWVFGLTMIILMPTVMPFLRERVADAG